MIKLGVDVQAKDRNGMTPLCYAVKLGNQNIADYLLKAGAVVEEADLGGGLPEWLVAMRLRNLDLEPKTDKIIGDL